MNQLSRSRLAAGALMILAGVIVLLAQLNPSIRSFFAPMALWTNIIILVGIGLLFIGLLAGAPDMAVPASIVTGIGGILAWQQVTGRYETWSFLWTLIPGFVGLGVILAGLIKGERWAAFRRGGELLFISLVMFVIFAAIMGELPRSGVLLPALLILAGLIILIRSFARR